jgi:hypothetical protein
MYVSWRSTSTFTATRSCSRRAIPIHREAPRSPCALAEPAFYYLPRPASGTNLEIMLCPEASPFPARDRGPPAAERPARCHVQLSHETRTEERNLSIPCSDGRPEGGDLHSEDAWLRSCSPRSVAACIVAGINHNRGDLRKTLENIKFRPSDTLACTTTRLDDRAMCCKGYSKRQTQSTRKRAKL